MATNAIILTCEHASNALPAPYRHLFVGQTAVFATHRAYDIGALHIARALSKALAAPLFSGNATRLLVDLNRAASNPNVFSTFSRQLSVETRNELINHYHAPFHQSVREAIDELLRNANRVTHISVHSHTPELNGHVRNNALGILYDPARLREVRVAKLLKATVQLRRADWHVRFNYPYRGTGDGHVTALRKTHSQRRYVGLELEINQRLLIQPHVARALAMVLSAALKDVLHSHS